MDTKLLEDALLLLECKSLSAAAERRNMTQPAFSRRIQALERWVGHPLVTRRANRVEISQHLTDNAARLRALLSHLSQVQRHLKDADPALRSLVVAAPHALSSSVVAEIIGSARTAAEPWRVRLLTGNQDDAISLFLNREADVLLSYENRALHRMPFDDSVQRFSWRSDAFLPVIGCGLCHFMGDDGHLSADTPSVGYPTGSMFGKILAAHEASQPARLPQEAVVETTFSLGAASLVRAGVAAAWVPGCLIQPSLQRGEVVGLSQDYGRIPMEIALYGHASHSGAMLFLQQVLASAARGDADPAHKAAQTSDAVASKRAGFA